MQRERVGKEEMDRVFSRNLAFAPCMNTSRTKRLVFTKHAEREGKEEKARLFSRNLAFTPCMNTSLTKRLVFTERERERVGKEEMDRVFHGTLRSLLV